MSMKTAFKAIAIGLILALAPVSAQYGFAQNLRVLSNGTSSALRVPMNRAVVVESDVPFAELSIANPAIADISTLSDRTVYVLGKTPGRTTLTLLNAEGRLITNVDVQVVPDIAEFKERIDQILPGEGIEVRTANDGIVLSGTVSSIISLDAALELAERYSPGRVSNLMSVGGTQQVMLKVRFAEMSRSVSKTLSSSIAVASNRFRGETGTYLDGANGIGQDLTVGSSSQGAFGFSFGGNSLRLEVLLEALESKGVVRTLSEPNLTALSGQEASFLAGGEYPVPVQDDDGISIEYKDFGVELNFLPRVLADEVINIELNAAVSSIDSSIGATQSGISVDGFSRREAQTTVQLRDGESFAIAGLLEDDFRDVSAQVPFLGDIPVLGALFRSAEYNRDQTELVIIITAHLVSPVRGEALALPTDRVTLPTEREFFLFGKVAGDGPTGAAGEIARQDFSGSYGYVMED
ncbi:pilus assembly protein CpaC [Palleronia marisminoris]|uniref:Type II secretion system protein D n=1 Tax=Palleronia marisminoris TaxID=315423 RepID=A0A1Y5T8J0_9RHOB|nr:type II and III secretion system protein family protein [Palleronia marisminoris]SFH15140.1 pilus assembly protein CpaC [Palleronia marisminoris]SLN54709.1 Type II secretion system protein D precursor [Palleronia marisminoris]